MVNASAVSKLLMMIEVRAKMENDTENVYVLFDDLKQIDLSIDDANEAVNVLENEPSYKCIELLDTDNNQVWIGVNLKPDFNDVRQSFHKFIQYMRGKDNAREKYPDVDWEELTKRFKNKDTAVYWGHDGVKGDGGLKRVPDNFNSTLKLIGNDVIIELKDNQYIPIKTLRTDQAPFFFLKYLMLHPDQVITKSVIQTEVEMCATKNDMTELVRQCGFGKEFKRSFFAGTTKDKVKLTPHANISLDTGFEGEW